LNNSKGKFFELDAQNVFELFSRPDQILKVNIAACKVLI